MSSDISQLSGASAKRALRFLDELARVEKIQVTVEGRSDTVALEGNRPTTNPFQLQLADDLAYIEDALNITLRYPDSVGELADRIWVRVVRLEPADGAAGVLIWSPSRAGDLTDFTPTPWVLDGVLKHPQLRRVDELGEA